MTNRNSANGGVDFVDESPTFQDMNDTFKAVTYRRLANSATGGSNNTTTPVLITTHAIGAGEVTSFIEGIIDINPFIRTDTGATPVGARDYHVRVDIGETGSEVIVKTFSITGVDDGDGYTEFTNLNIDNQLYYEPSTAEKTNGFNVKIYCYVGSIIGGDVSVALSRIDASRIMGV